MCVLICRVADGPAARSFLGANRDEAYARPFSAPRRWVAETVFWAPRDEEEGGTWIGVNENGLIAAITNLSRLPEQRGLASRGHLVSGALARPDVDAAQGFLASELEGAPRNPCQILLLSGARATVCRITPGRALVLGTRPRLPRAQQFPRLRRDRLRTRRRHVA
jgi:hypothetical protein